ncbi:MAG: hypothetical protein M3396_10965 [Actinomycetota bacterium]|nr:hypothetical protein [Actinomycetota bacterium]
MEAGLIDGTKLSESSWLEPGWRLVIPADAFGLPEAPRGAMANERSSSMRSGGRDHLTSAI